MNIAEIFIFGMIVFVPLVFMFWVIMNAVMLFLKENNRKRIMVPVQSRFNDTDPGPVKASLVYCLRCRTPMKEARGGMNCPYCEG